MGMKHLLLLTDGFPFGGNETFLYPEIEYLSQKFVITVVTTDMKFPLSPDYHWDFSLHRMSLSLYGFRHLLYSLKALNHSLMWQEIGRIIKDRRFFLRRIKDALYVYRKAIILSEYLQKHNLLEGKDLVYCYWHHHAPLGVHLAQKHTGLTTPIVCRAHGYDLYNERIDGLRQPFKQYVDMFLNGVFFVSQKGYDYYQESFGFDSACSYNVARLGVNKAFEKNIESEESVFRIVSISNLIPLKRVSLIIEALSLVNSFEVEWIHFGMGAERNNLQEQAKALLGDSTNITYTFKGSVPNSQILEFYQNNAVDVFISTSSSEGGCPVSIQEAFAYSIPVIAPTVGGITEMMKDGENGFILSENPTPFEIKEKIEQVYLLKVSERIDPLKRGAYKTWDSMFRADKNFLTFPLLSLIP